MKADLESRPSLTPMLSFQGLRNPTIHVLEAVRVIEMTVYTWFSASPSCGKGALFFFWIWDLPSYSGTDQSVMVRCVVAP
jgi:hypothetical protein